MRVQLYRLVHPGFVSAAGADPPDDVARYVSAIDRRLAKLPSAAARDRALAERVHRLEQRYDDLLALVARRGAVVADELLDVRWQLEELRVSLFAQALGTRGTVS